MYERMLNKKEVPTIAVMTAYCGERRVIYLTERMVIQNIWN